MKRKLKIMLALTLCVFSSLAAAAYDFHLNGIYYNITGTNTVEVTYSGYANYVGDVTIPASVNWNSKTYFVKSIGDLAFTSCFNVTSVTISDGITSIGEQAFSGCMSLSSVSIPSSITFIGHSAFFLCSSLTSVSIPEGVTSIEQNSFYCCDSLTSFTIPSTVTSIGPMAFSGCDSLTSIYSYAVIPPDCSYVSPFYVFDYSICTLYVPAQSIYAYKEDENWSKFFNIKPVEAGSVETVTRENHNITARKFIKEGQLYIIIDDKTYNISGGYINSNN